MKKRFYILCAAVSLCLTSCGGSSQVSAVENGVAYNMSYDSAPSGNYTPYAEETEQKLIRRVSIELELESNAVLEENTEKLQQMVRALGGYTANVSLDNRDSWANGRLEVRVPKEKVDTFLYDIKSMGLKVTSVSDSAEDVTMQYTDVQTRLEVQETALKKYKQYLEDAENIEDFLSIEQRIDSLVAEIESYKAQLQVLDNQIDYTEVTIRINCKTSINRDSFWVRLGARLKDIGYGVGDTFLDGLEWFANALVVLLFAAPIGVLVIKLFQFAIKFKFKLPRRKKGSDDRSSVPGVGSDKHDDT